ncbi:armadillo repeat-containing protein 10 isoform X1 [Erythrolamprus reginae]|uniref:armadillo repeat-containing protein 10 isoform X1 n=1 Tax=Erythrolamprus reginae TaxID=121349 RepID=UPI00396D00D2
MKEPGGWTWRVGLAGLAAAGIAYGLYRATSRRKKGGRASPGPPRASEGKPAGLGGGEASGSPRSSGPHRAPLRGFPQGGSDGSNSTQGVLEGEHLEKLLYLLDITEDPVLQGQILVTLSNSAAFSVNQDLIRALGGLVVIGKMLSVPFTDVRQKALNALNNLSMNAKNQEELKVYITRVCEEVDDSSVNSELQLAGLRFLTNISVTNNYHYMMTSFVPNFLHLLFEGNERTQIQVLKVLVNLSANPAMAEHLLNSQAPLLLSLFDDCINKDILLRVLVFATNLTKSMRNDKGSSAIHNEHRYNEDSIFSTLSDNSLYTQKLASLLHHYDAEVKEQAAKLIMQQC